MKEFMTMNKRSVRKFISMDEEDDCKEIYIKGEGGNMQVKKFFITSRKNTLYNRIKRRLRWNRFK